MKLLRYILIVVITFYSTLSLAQINFRADTTSGCDPFRVNFQIEDNSSIDTITNVYWYFGNGDTATVKEPEALYDSAGTFTVTLIINSNDTITKPDYISVFPTPDAYFLYSDTVELGTYAVVFNNVRQRVDSVSYFYQWDLSDGTTGDTTRTLVHTFPAEGAYIARLIVTNSLGCTDTVFRQVEVWDTLDVPNVFSPNQDGINDCFVVKSNGKTVYSIQIFSKTGILVYRTEASIIIWDGRNMSGQELSPGTYYYIIKPVDSSSPYQKAGFVELFR